MCDCAVHYYLLLATCYLRLAANGLRGFKAVSYGEHGPKAIRDQCDAVLGAADTLLRCGCPGKLLLGASERVGLDAGGGGLGVDDMNLVEAAWV